MGTGALPLEADPGAAGPTDAERGAVLTALAREAIAAVLGLAEDPPEDPPGDPPAGGAGWLDATGACFVTLTDAEGALRGCIGTVEAFRPLGDDVRANAVAAAFRDPRFPPLARHELARVRVGVSVLSPLAPLTCADEADAARRLRRGVDGVVLEAGRRRATFLPQVWDQLPGPEAFLKALKHKAGLPVDHWGPEVRLWRYTVTRYDEGAP